MTLMTSLPAAPAAPERPRNTLRRLLWTAVPLLTIAWYAAPEWPARVAMTQDPWRGWLYTPSQRWATRVATVEQHLGVNRADGTNGADGISTTDAAATAADEHQDGPVSPEMRTTLATLAASSSAGTSSLAVPMLSSLPGGAPGGVGPSGPSGTGNLPPQGAGPAAGDAQQQESQAPGVPNGPHGTLLAVGDSLMAEVAAGLKEGLPADLKVKDAHKVSTGLTNQGYYDWPDEAKARAADVHPDWVVFHMGGNDGQDMLINKRWVHFGSDEWKATYLARAEEMIDNVRAVDPAVKLVWIGLPAMRDATYGSKMTVISALQKEASAARGVIYVDGHEALGPTYQKEGTFDGHRKVWRADDGIHYSREGGRLLARVAAKDPELHWDWSDTRR